MDHFPENKCSAYTWCHSVVPLEVYQAGKTLTRGGSAVQDDGGSDRLQILSQIRTMTDLKFPSPLGITHYPRVPQLAVPQKDGF